MKRCPQCSFIYEDDQRLCEMDGKELVHDPRSFPVAGNAATRRDAAKSPLRHFVVLVAAFFLAAVLFVVYYASPRRVSSKPAPVAPKIENSESGTSNPSLSNAPTESPTETPLASTDSPSPTPSDAAVTESRSLRSSKRPYSFPAPITPGASPTATPVHLLSQSSVGVPVTVLTVRPSASPAAPVAPKLDEDKTKAPTQKKESKLGSFFKKAGRILKKPFSSKPSPK